MGSNGTTDRTGWWHRYRAWRRANRWHLSPNGFIVLVVIAIAIGVVTAFVGPSGDGAAVALGRGLVVGAVIAVIGNLLARRERRRARGPG